MYHKITPEQAGIPSKNVKKLIETLNKRGLVMHSVLLMKGNNIFAEYYWKPFHKDFCHRMYSETKSYVAIAIGLLEQDGKINLNDPVYKYFPDRIDQEPEDYLKELTVKDLLTMQTTGNGPSWFKHPDPDRTHMYFANQPFEVPAGMRWKYDSAGSQVLASLVEKLSGMTLFDFLYSRIFSKLGTFQTATILKTKNGDSWGDSALLCTTRDMASCARFLMDNGNVNGEQILNENFIQTATSSLADNDTIGFDGVLNRGYGYQIWRSDRNGFAFNGMGAQFTIAIPEKDLIFVCTADNQGYPEAKALILTAFYELIVDEMQESPLEENPIDYKLCCELENQLELSYVSGPTDSPYASCIDGVTFICDPNPMGITKFSFHFNDDYTGVLNYTNEQGDKSLSFGLGKNAFTKFPQFGYSDTHGGLVTENGFLYDCAVSAAWREPQKICVKVQIIDKYFGNLYARFAFKDTRASVTMVKTAENFLDEYSGTLNAKRV